MILPRQLPLGLCAAVMLLPACDSTEPAPSAAVISAVTPDTLPAGSPATDLTVDGSGFAPASVVQWNGSDRATTFVGDERLTVSLTTADLSDGMTGALQVRSGDSLSNTVTVVVMNPPPRVDSIAPGIILTGSTQNLIVIRGGGFVPSSVSHLGKTSRTTVFVDSQTLWLALLSGDSDTGRVDSVLVINRAPGGGTSSRAVTFANPVPILHSLVPPNAPTAAAPFALTLRGIRFAPGAMVLWNGVPRAASWISATEVSIPVGGADLAASGYAQLAVQNPLPAGGSSSALSFTVGSPTIVHDTASAITVLNLTTQFLAADQPRSVLFAAAGDSVIALDAATASRLWAVSAGGPVQLIAVSDDGSRVYAATSGGPAIRRINTTSHAVELTISLGTDPNLGDTLRAGALVVAPGSAGATVVARINPHSSPEARGVELLEDAVSRGVVLPFPFGELASNRLAFAGIPGVVYGLDAGTTEHAVRRYNVGTSIFAAWKRTGLFGVSTDVLFGGFGRLFGGSGTVVDPEAGIVEGSIAAGWMWVDVQAGRVFVLAPSGGLSSWNPLTRQTVADLVWPGWTGTAHLVRWGVDGFAFRTNTQVIILRSALASR